MLVKLITIQDVKDLVDLALKHPRPIYVSLDNYIVAASSLMGILSLDLSRPIKLSSDEFTQEFIEGTKHLLYTE